MTALLAPFAAHERAVAGLAANTVANHRLYLTAYARWWAAQRPARGPRAATAADVAAFLVAEERRGLTAATRKAELAALRRFHRWLVLVGEAGGDPTVGLAAPRVPPPATEVYTPEQVTAILAHTATLTDPRGRQRHALVATLRWTGMRSAELRRLAVADLHLDAGWARVLGKGARPRAVLLAPPLVPVLRGFLTEVRPLLPASPLLLANAHPYVTTAEHGFGQQALAREVELAGLGARVAGRHYPHRWRHTFATECLRAGLDIHVVQRLLGHTNIVSTVGYTHLVLDDLQAAFGAMWA